MCVRVGVGEAVPRTITEGVAVLVLFRVLHIYMIEGFCPPRMLRTYMELERKRENNNDVEQLNGDVCAMLHGIAHVASQKK